MYSFKFKLHVNITKNKCSKLFLLSDIELVTSKYIANHFYLHRPKDNLLINSSVYFSTYIFTVSCSFNCKTDTNWRNDQLDEYINKVYFL